MDLNQGISGIIKSRCMNFSDFLQQVKDLKSMQVIFLRIASFFYFWVRKDPNGPKIFHGLRHYDENWKVPRSNPTRCLGRLWDLVSLRGSL